MNIIPKPLKRLIDRLTILPGVGPKSAQRMALHILQKKQNEALSLAEALTESLTQITTCDHCKNFTECSPCIICRDPNRNQKTICVVESISDLISIEQTGAYQGVYFVLSGHLSPIDQIGPEDIHIPILLSRIETQQIEEIILATNGTIEGETTAHYIVSHLDASKKVTRLAAGVPIGAELEFLNTNTLYHAIQERTKINQPAQTSPSPGHIQHSHETTEAL